VRRSKKPALRIVVAAVICLLASSILVAKDEKKQEASTREKTYQRSTDLTQYVGSEECKSCHEEEFKAYRTSPHFQTTLDTHRGPAWQGCEACHGPGKEHIESDGEVSKIFSFTKVKSEEASRQCLDCHQLGEDHSNFLRSEHQKQGIGCIDCHSAHKPTTSEGLLKNTQPQLCYGCHLEAKADFMKPYHHRVNEGLVGCSDCHNPHGGFLTKQLRSTAAQDAGCFKCHAEKAGPFVFEHVPVKTEGCVSCHTPHGSSNPRLLRRANVNLLCLECHTLTVDSPVPGVPAFHNQAQKYQACTMCHVNIHGSNFSEVFFK
jgi:DmsE family decaheme c-type cytochrome